ncbi:MAG: substrate-binding domain-containing protein [Oscillospiraceae bacterium]|nr:substrate-binding domain-containing protein [Oscillospiraceae bacterium]
MKARKFLSLAIAVLLLLGSFGVMSGCASQPPAPAPAPETAPTAEMADENIVIGMANLALGDYFTGMRNAVVTAGEARGWTVHATNANGDDAQLVSHVENFIAQGVDGIIISGAWFNDIPAALDAAEAAGIPVVLVDRMFDSQNFTAWVGPDNEFMGEQIGEFIVSQLPEGGTAVIIRGGPPENTIGINRTAGVTRALTAAGNFTIEVSPDFAGWSTDGGKTAMENMLARFPSIDVVFCENDSMAFGAQSAAADAGRSDEMFFTGIDGANPAILAILEGGNYMATGHNDANVIGAEGVAVMARILAGEPFEKINVMYSPIITVENAEQFRNAGIWG